MDIQFIELYNQFIVFNIKKPNNLPVRSRDSTKPVERIGGGGVGNTVKRDLTTDQVDEEGDNSPKTTLTERNLFMNFQN